MPNFRWAIICEKAVVDSRTNNVSLIEVVEQFNVGNLPITVPQFFYVVILWEKDISFKGKDEPFSFKIVITHKKRAVSSDEGKTFEVKIPKDKLRFRSVCGIRGIPIEKEKTLYFRIFLKSEDKWKEIFSIPVEVKKNQLPN